MDQLKKEFEELLWKKVVNRPDSRQLAYYYRRQFEKTGRIPKGLQLVTQGIYDGRKASGRPRAFRDDVRQAFMDLVKQSTESPESINFITQPLRTLNNYRERIVELFGEEHTPNLQAFYSLCKRHGLWRYVTKPDYQEVAGSKRQHFFAQQSVYELLQMDGCVFHTFEILTPDGGYKSPQVIEILDTGSRYMFACDVYWSESNANSIDIMQQWLTNNPLPKQMIHFRPDNAKGFTNLKRCLAEMNRKYGSPTGFYLNDNYARAGKGKDKSHLETSHRVLHKYEDTIIRHFKAAGAFDGTTKRTSFKTRNKIKEITVTRLRITLEDLRQSGLIERYRSEIHNGREHNFSKGAMREKWAPTNKYNEWLADKTEADLIRFTPEEVEGFFRYGYDKRKASVQPDGTLQFNNRTYYVVGPTDWLNFNSGTPVHASEHNGKLYLFENNADGPFIAEAVTVTKYEREKEDVASPGAVSIAAPKKPPAAGKQNEFEMIVAYLVRQGMQISESHRQRLLTMHREGLTLDKINSVIEANQEHYNSYRSNSDLSNAQVSLVLVNLFFSHLAESDHRPPAQIIPYAKIGG